MASSNQIECGCGIREEPLWDNVATTLSAAGLDKPAAVGKVVVPVHDDRLATLELRLVQKQAHDSEPSEEAMQPLYGDDGLLTSFRNALQDLVDSLILAYGEVEVSFAAGQATECRITISIRPNESFKFDQLRR
jgi:hypothetical protein